MDLIAIIDLAGERGTALAGGAVLGLAFGIAAQRSGFCTRTAVLDVLHRRGGQGFATWLVGFATALLLVQRLILSGNLSVDETRYFSVQSLSGPLFGGLLFGVGMILTRGCVSRLTVLAGSGNLRALYGLGIVGAAGLATLAGFLTPLRDMVAALQTTAALGTNDLLAILGWPRVAGVFAGGAILAAAVVTVFLLRLSWMRALGGAAVGCVVAAGWYFTYSLSAQAFDPVAVESLSFVRPVAGTIGLAAGLWPAAGFDQGLLAGALAGAFLAAALSGDFRIATFSQAGAPGLVRYTAGSALMGFGGVLAGGCTIGAGLTGGSILALSHLLALLAMMAGAAVAATMLGRERS